MIRTIFLLGTIASVFADSDQYGGCNGYGCTYGVNSYGPGGVSSTQYSVGGLGGQVGFGGQFGLGGLGLGPVTASGPGGAASSSSSAAGGPFGGAASSSAAASGGHGFGVHQYYGSNFGFNNYDDGLNFGVGSPFGFGGLGGSASSSASAAGAPGFGFGRPGYFGGFPGFGLGGSAASSSAASNDDGSAAASAAASTGARAGVSGPGVGYPGVGYPGVGYPGVGYPGVGYPGVGYPGVGYPGVGYPGVGYPGVGYPGVGYPGNVPVYPRVPTLPVYPGVPTYPLPGVPRKSKVFTCIVPKSISTLCVKECFSLENWKRSLIIFSVFLQVYWGPCLISNSETLITICNIYVVY